MVSKVDYEVGDSIQREPKFRAHSGSGVGLLRVLSQHCQPLLLLVSMSSRKRKIV